MTNWEKVYFCLSSPVYSSGLYGSWKYRSNIYTDNVLLPLYKPRPAAYLSLIFILKFKSWSLFIYFYEIFHEIQYYGAHSDYDTFRRPWLCFPNTNWKCIYYYYTRFQRLHTGLCLRMASTHFIICSSMWLQRKVLHTFKIFKI